MHSILHAAATPLQKTHTSEMPTRLVICFSVLQLTQQTDLLMTPAAPDSVVCSRRGRNQQHYLTEIHLVSVLAKIKELNNVPDTFKALTLQLLPMIKC